jgi:PKD repeat protein
MRSISALVLAIVTAVTLASCGGGDYTGNQPPADLGELDYSITADPGSSIESSEIKGHLLSVADALDAKAASALPAGFAGRQGMLFTPQSAPGTGFSGTLRVQLTLGNPAAGEYDGVLLYLYYIDPATHAATLLNTGRGDTQNYVSFKLNALGYFVVAENSSVPRPGGFIVNAYADLANAPVGAEVRFWAVPSHGTAPYTYTWDFGDGATATAAEAVHAYTASGSYNVELTAVDATGTQAPAVSTPIDISSGPAGPLGIESVSVTQDAQNHLLLHYAVTLSGGTVPFTYHWVFDEDDPAALGEGGAATEHTFTTEGLYLGSVEVSDGTGASVTQAFASDARWLQLTANPQTGMTPLNVDFTLVRLGFDASDAITIDYGDGNTETVAGTTAFHRYTVAGLYNAQAQSVRNIGDEQYRYDSNAVNITVTGGASDPFIQLTQPLLPKVTEPFDIVGCNFGEAADNKTVRIGGFTMDVLSWTDNIIRIQVPYGLLLTDGTATVYLGATPVSNTIQVTFNRNLIPSRIQNVIPPVAVPGARVLITGHGFPPVLGVTVGGQPALVEQQHANGIVALLPGGLAAGRYDLQVGTGAAMLSFRISVLDTLEGDIPALDTAVPTLQEVGHGNVTLTGSRLGLRTTAVVYAEGYALPRSMHSNSSIALSEPGVDIDSWVCVINRNHVSNALPVSFMHRPQITGVTPVEAAAGDTITLAGSYFGSQVLGDQVLIGQTALTISTWNNTVITAVIPEGAKDGQLVVAKKLQSNGIDFTVIPQIPGPPSGGQI